MAESSDAYPEFKEQMNFLSCKIWLCFTVLIQAKLQLALMEALAEGRNLTESCKI